MFPFFLKKKTKIRRTNMMSEKMIENRDTEDQDIKYMGENLKWEDLVRSTEKVAEQFATLKQKMNRLEDDFEQLSEVIRQFEEMETEPEMGRESTEIEEMEERFERRFTAIGHLPKGKKRGMMLYSHRATRIEMMAIEKRRSSLTLKISKGGNSCNSSNSSNGRKNHGKGGSRVTSGFQKVKKVVDQGKKKLNKEWQRANRPRNTRPWGNEEEK
jgi:hypothetical protein